MILLNKFILRKKISIEVRPMASSLYLYFNETLRSFLYVSYGPSYDCSYVRNKCLEVGLGGNAFYNHSFTISNICMIDVCIDRTHAYIYAYDNCWAEMNTRGIYFAYSDRETRAYRDKIRSWI